MLRIRWQKHITKPIRIINNADVATQTRVCSTVHLKKCTTLCLDKTNRPYFTVKLFVI